MFFIYSHSALIFEKCSLVTSFFRNFAASSQIGERSQSFFQHTAMKKQLFQFNEVPADWALCFHDTCPVHEECQRWLAGSYAPKKMTVRPCVIAPSLELTGACRYYVNPEPVTLAYGFSDLFSRVRRNEYEPMRRALFAIFGSESSYYRCKRGERAIMPDEQKAIIELFSKYGYADVVKFDRTVQAYDFPLAQP